MYRSKSWEVLSTGSVIGAGVGVAGTGVGVAGTGVGVAEGTGVGLGVLMVLQPATIIATVTTDIASVNAIIFEFFMMTPPERRQAEDLTFMVGIVSVVHVFYPGNQCQIMATRTISISGESIRFMMEDCALRSPEEACGLIAGRFDDAVAHATDVMPVRNESMSTMRFSIDPVVMYKALVKLEEKGETIIGVYHSHPSGSRPSYSDVSYMEGTSYIWVIVEKCDSVKAFVHDGEVKEVGIKKMEESAAAFTSRGSG